MFHALFGLLAGMLGAHWAISEKEARNLGQAWHAWIKSLGPKKANALNKFTKEVAPTITLIGVFGSVVGPRVQTSLELRSRQPQPPQRPPQAQPFQPPRSQRIEGGPPASDRTRYRPRNGLDEGLEMGFPV